MNKGHSVKPADHSDQVWSVLDVEGRQIAACSSRRNALRIAALANKSVNMNTLEGCETSRVNKNVGQELNKPITPQLQTLKWYSPRQTGPVWPLLKKYYVSARVFVCKILQRAG